MALIRTDSPTAAGGFPSRPLFTPISATQSVLAQSSQDTFEFSTLAAPIPMAPLIQRPVAPVRLPDPHFRYASIQPQDWTRAQGWWAGKNIPSGTDANIQINQDYGAGLNQVASGVSRGGVVGYAQAFNGTQNVALGVAAEVAGKGLDLAGQAANLGGQLLEWWLRN